jgi:hypothetical protein
MKPLNQFALGFIIPSILAATALADGFTTTVTWMKKLLNRSCSKTNQDERET